MQPRGGMMQPAQSSEMLSQEAQVSSILNGIEQRIGSQNFNNWFRGNVTLTILEDKLAIGVRSPFLLSWMQKKFRQDVTASAQDVLGLSAVIHFEVDATIPVAPQSENSGSTLSESNSDRADKSAGNPKASSRDAKPASQSSRTVLRGRQFAKLKDFVEGPCNALAMTASRQVCESPGSRFNPLFLYGGVGTGKTHLLEGIYSEVRRQFPSLRVMYLTAEAFANYFTQALRERTLPGFRQKFRNVDLLLVDDVDFFDSKRVIQEEFLHTFKQLEGQSCQIVLASDSHPRLLSKTSDELVTRFLSGMMCRLESPDLETRQNFVQLKASRMNVNFSEEALFFVAQRFQKNVRELEGALNCLATYHAMTGKRISLPLARKVLSELERDCVRIVRISDVEQVVCDFFGVESRELKSAGRQRSVSRPRMLAMYLSRKLTQAAYSEIGQFFGGRNHATVMSAEKNVQNWLKEGREFKVASQTWRLDEVIESLELQLQAS